MCVVSDMGFNVVGHPRQIVATAFVAENKINFKTTCFDLNKVFVAFTQLPFSESLLILSKDCTRIISNLLKRKSNFWGTLKLL